MSEVNKLTPLLSTIITGIITLVVGGLTLLGVIYQSNKNFDKQQAQADTQQRLLEQKFEDYQELVDRNRQRALEHGDWKVRIEWMMGVMKKQGYEV